MYKYKVSLKPTFVPFEAQPGAGYVSDAWCKTNFAGVSTPGLNVGVVEVLSVQ
jgi:hypothetical protein